MTRWLAGLSIAALVAIPAALSFVPGFPTHGYGHVLLLYPLVPALLHPGRRRRLALYAAGLVLQFLAFPDPDLGFLGWVLLWPYLLAREREDGAPWKRSAFLYGFLRAFAGFYWIGNVHYTGWIGVSLASGFAFVVAFEWPLRRLTFVPYPFRVAACWLLFEGFHSWFIGGLPWLLLAHTQYRFLPLIQMADLVGAYGVSFVVAFVQAAALDLARARRFTASAGAAAALLAVVLLYGAMRRGSGGPEGPGVLMIQTAVPSYVKEREEARPLLGPAPMRLTKEGLAAHPDTALVVWPETMFPADYLESDPEEGETPRVRGFRAEFPRYARNFARAFGKPAVFGISSYPDVARATRARGYNAAILVDAKGDPARDPATGKVLLYRKQRLVPMSEEFLLRRVLPDAWCDSIFDWLGANFGLPRSSDLLAGEGFVTLDAGPGLRCALLICFEGVYPSLARGAVNHGDPDVLLHLVNNGWFLSPRFLGWRVPSFEQRQCLPIWVFRAIETRTPFLSCANAGITCGVAPDGRFLGRIDKVMEEGWLHLRVPPRWPRPFFVRGGFLLPPPLLLLVLAAFLRRARRRP